MSVRPMTSTAESRRRVISGTRPSTPVWRRIVEAAHLAVHAYPLLLMGGGLCYVGLLAIGPRRKDIFELWIFLPAGLALVGIYVGIGYWLWWRLPRLTLTRFEFDGSELLIEVPSRDPFSVPIRDLSSLTESRGRRRLLGWWLRFDGMSSVFLDVATDNAVSLIDELRTLTGRDQSTRNSR